MAAKTSLNFDPRMASRKSQQTSVPCKEERERERDRERERKCVRVCDERTNELMKERMRMRMTGCERDFERGE